MYEATGPHRVERSGGEQGVAVTFGERPMRVAVHAGVVSGQAGGTQQVLIGLVAALSKLTDGDEKYLILSYASSYEWLEPYVGGPAVLLPVLSPPPMTGVATRLGGLRPAARFIRDQWHLVRGPRSIAMEREPEAVTREQPDLIHFPTQNAFLTSRPNIFHPWDLLHLNAPHLFSSYQRMYREVVYRTFCAQASLVSVASPWVGNDLREKYGLPAERIAVVPMAAPTEFYPVPTREDIAATRAKFHLPDEFLYYPAQTYPHKNHLRLFEALDLIRRRHSVTIPLVCSGWISPFHTTLEADLRKRSMQDQVRFLGFLNPLEVQCLYRAARAMAFPSESEGWGLPILEAFAAATPVASSNVMSLPDQVGDAGLLFNPQRADEMADAIWRVWTDDELRRRLQARGSARTAQYSWDRTARHFRAYYRTLGGASLTSEDRLLLNE